MEMWQNSIIRQLHSDGGNRVMSYVFPRRSGVTTFVIETAKNMNTYGGLAVLLLTPNWQDTHQLRDLWDNITVLPHSAVRYAVGKSYDFALVDGSVDKIEIAAMLLPIVRKKILFLETTE